MTNDRNKEISGLSRRTTLIGLASLGFASTIPSSAVAERERIIEVSTRGDLDRINDDLTANYVLTNDIDLSIGGDFEPIGGNPTRPRRSEEFSGTFDGDGYTISNLTISDQTARSKEREYTGLFSRVGSGIIENLHLENINVVGERITGGLVGRNDEGIIKNIHLENANITGKGIVGGLVGASRGTVNRVRVTGSVEARTRAGGLVGTNIGSVTESTADVSVTGGNTGGGLVGTNNSGGSVEDSYAVGDVNAESDQGGSGGLSSNNQGQMKRCYSASTVSSPGIEGGLLAAVSNPDQSEAHDLYWNTDIVSAGVGSGDISGVTGLNTSEMTGDAAQENMAGFDFTDVWTVTDEYPELRWLAPEIVPDPPTATFSVQPNQLVVNEAITFDASGSTSPDADIVSYTWDFGDGSEVDTTESKINHTYEVGGVYTVSLVVTDTNNLSAETSTDVTILTPPSVEFTISPPDPIVGEQIDYDASESTASDGDIVTFDWNFGDGTETLVEDVTISHTYESSETYTTTMTATDDNGLSGTASADISVLSPASAVAALRDNVDALGLHRGTAQSLRSSLNAAERSLTGGNERAGVNQLTAFSNKVTAQRTKNIEKLDADQLITHVERIRSAVENNSTSDSEKKNNNRNRGRRGR